MRRHVLLGSYVVVVASMLASSGAAVNGAPATRPEGPAPTYMNGEVVRVDAKAGLTLRNESGETEQRVDGQARAEIAGLRTGDRWFHLLDGTIPEPDQDGCRQQYRDMIGRGERLRESIKLAEDAARKAEVQPGRMREALERHRLDL